MLDIHPDASSDAGHDGPSLEILEAGTGHGALTLHLARAIHAANVSSLPPGESPELPRTKASGERRQAIVHSIDVSARYSEHAKKLVQGFRRGLYSNDIDFYVSNVSDWVDQQIKRRQLREKERKTFLSHIVLDMPNSYEHIGKVTSILHPQGSLILFNPSITQIISAVETIGKQNIPMYLDRVLELGPSMTRGKEWDIRVVKPRAQAEDGRRSTSRTGDGSSDPREKENHESSLDDVDASLDKTNPREYSNPQALDKEQQGYEIVCRPKTFARVVGGGFIGLWKKKSLRNE